MRLREQRSLQPLSKVRHEGFLETPVLSIKESSNYEGSTPTASISELAQKKRQGSSRIFSSGFNSSPNWQSRRSNLSLSRSCMEVLA